MSRETTCCFSGHRPKYFNEEYDIQSDFYKPFIKNITEYTERMIKRNVDTFISGGALGVDMIAFFCVHKLKSTYPNIKNILALPFERQGANWSEKDKQWIEMMKNLADEVVIVDEVQEYKIGRPNVYNPKKLQRRNEYMVDKSGHMIAVWNGEDSGTKNCISYGLLNKTNVKYIYITKGDTNMKITKTAFHEEFEAQMKALNELYQNKVKGEEVNAPEIFSNIIGIIDETGKDQIEFNEESPLEKVLKDVCEVVEINSEDNTVKFKERDGDISVVINI